MVKRQVSIAFIGAGYMTAEHIKAFADIPEVVISGNNSRTREKAEKISSQ